MTEGNRVSTEMVDRIWQENGLAADRFLKSRLFNDQVSAAKGEEVIGLCFDPAERAVMLSIDEKAQSQTLRPTQLGLPMK